MSAWVVIQSSVDGFRRCTIFRVVAKLEVDITLLEQYELFVICGDIDGIGV